MLYNSALVGSLAQLVVQRTLKTLRELAIDSYVVDIKAFSKFIFRENTLQSSAKMCAR
jgi:tetrahydromethanopterin S-methyltransferase subunit F